MEVLVTLPNGSLTTVDDLEEGATLEEVLSGLAVKMDAYTVRVNKETSVGSRVLVDGDKVHVKEIGTIRVTVLRSPGGRKWKPCDVPENDATLAGVGRMMGFPDLTTSACQINGRPVSDVTTKVSEGDKVLIGVKAKGAASED